MSMNPLSSALRAALGLAALGLLALGASGCSEEPTETNALTAALPLKEVIVHDTTIVAVSGDTYRLNTVMDDVVTMVGASGGRTAVAALQWASLPIRDTVGVFSASVTLRFLTWSGDSTGDLSFNVYRISRSWSEGYATWDTLQANFYSTAKLIGHLTSSAGADTQEVTFAVDTAMVREWLATGTDSTNTKYGIVLVPDASCRIMRGFNAFGYDSTRFSPTLTVVAGSTNGTNLDTTVYTSGYDTFFGDVPYMGNASLLFAQCGVQYRSRLTFDVSFIPRTAIINRADLQVRRDAAASRLNRFSDSSFGAGASLSTTDFSSLDAGVTSAHRMTDSALTYTLDARRPAQLWVHGENYGLTIYPSLVDGRRSMDLFAFRSPSAPNAADRPRLRITYTTLR
jgi:hypothetical protein